MVEAVRKVPLVSKVSKRRLAERDKGDDWDRPDM
jgi:hypothetical protein